MTNRQIGKFERPLKVKKDGVFLFVISHLVPEIFKNFVLCKLGTADVIRYDNIIIIIIIIIIYYIYIALYIILYSASQSWKK